MRGGKECLKWLDEIARRQDCEAIEIPIIIV